ncbi:sigma-E factor negative regulatory protein [Pseudomonas sp. EpS/L25]|uniref:sigma-E factor negative regulatory protein n=1 Tax=Pseudomonas sp. EpS/L25 TaxID=1749078 RepID=UPI0007444D9F|nr:RseA family anti-sigma factor [Pseudomonas sp. EpS/L25]KUM44884.1 anti-sigma factor [Pseudomonas sp. EpS/L25]
MSREALLESLSAVMDNEADEFETRRVLAEVSKDPELRATWSRYAMVSAVIRGEPMMPNLDIARGVTSTLERDEVAAAPAAPAAAPVASRRWSGWSGIGRVAVAASVTFAVLAGVRMYNQSDVSTQGLAQQTPSQLSVPQPARSPAVLASFSEESTKANANSKADQPAAGDQQETPAQR